ncbi:flagellar basal-body rod protein FlgC [Thiogranum longum]|uniref:Flagellar basal-body rod protein FlgC n=1 Tax=Thiogranum longum TaxID=1537524 RepID=A0A4R1HF86_9GAMM|nr:flagellar basal body rod protein FlgC [Thiogranum longum]TCK18870.1 flagellar basal-body rod protein FlgC [Thiogranum longum]
MSLFNIFSISGSAMSAESLRLNTTASNLANAQSIGSSEATTYRAKNPVFAAMMQSLQGDNVSFGVEVKGVVDSTTPLETRYQPEHPMANEEGYVFLPNVNVVDEMANMISASRAYQSNVEVLNTSKQLMMATLRLGQ